MLPAPGNPKYIFHMGPGKFHTSNLSTVVTPGLLPPDCYDFPDCYAFLGFSDR